MEYINKKWSQKLLSLSILPVFRYTYMWAKGTKSKLYIFLFLQDLEEFMESSEYGVVVFSMGASFNVDVAKSLLPKLFDAFSRLPQKILMKILTPTFMNVPPNVKLVSWFPQQDVLGNSRFLIWTWVQCLPWVRCCSSNLEFDTKVEEHYDLWKFTHGFV